MLDSRAERHQRVRNAVQSTLLLCCLVVAVGTPGWLLFGPAGLLWLLGLAVVVLLVRPRVPARTVLSVYGAQPLPYAAAPDLHEMLRELSARAGLPVVPALYYVASPVPNCFGLGPRRDPVLAVTDGLLRRLTRREFAGVLAHEIGHVRAGDTAVMTLSDTISRLAQGLSWLGLLGVLIALPLSFRGDWRLLPLAALLVVLPVIVSLVQLALSRSREFEADLAAAHLTGDPEGLAAALEVLESSTGRLWERILVARAPAQDPLLLRTHPTTAERTRRLRQLEPPQARLLAVGRATPPAGYPAAEEPPRLRFPGIRW